MDRRTFLASAGALALTPMPPAVPKKKWRCVDMRFIESLGRWVPEKWCFDALIVRCAIYYDLEYRLGQLGTDTTGRKVNIFYDTIKWRGMQHDFIGYVDLKNDKINPTATATSYSYKITSTHPDVTSRKIVCMDYSVVDYPEKQWWNDLKDYGETVAHIAQERL